MEPHVYAGVDVSKDRLDVDWGNCRAYPNTAKGIMALLKKLKAAGVRLVAVESTGGYEQGVVVALQAAEIPVAVVNPFRTKKFAESLGYKAKTDRIDAKILRLYAERMQPEPQAPVPERVKTMKLLLERRLQLVEMVVAEKNRRQSPLQCSKTKASVRRMLKVLQREIKGIEREVNVLITANQDLRLIADTVQTEKGVGPVLTLAILADLPEIGTLNRAQVASLVGVAPFDKQSGGADNQRRPRGGRKRLRHTLYMATVCAIRRNQRLKAFYINLVTQGKKKMVALVATMRKFVIRLNSLVRDLRQKNPAIAFAFA
ncbi:MAG: IS110 family transposase [Alphaproteobacteria bacterium]